MLFNPLQQLKDIHLPQAIRFFPTAPGWIFLFTLMTIGLGYLLFYLFISSKRKQKRILLKKLQYTVDYLQNKPNKLIAELNLLMKQAALVVYPREKIVPLTGINWLNFLDKTGKTNQFSQGIGKVFLTGPYEKLVKTDVKRLESIIIKWIKTNV